MLIIGSGAGKEVLEALDFRASSIRIAQLRPTSDRGYKQADNAGLVSLPWRVTAERARHMESPTTSNGWFSGELPHG